jgi:predicted enzyme related to lactoylglutathione lyase
VAFYSALGGFKEEAMQMPNGTYHVLSSEGKPRAGVMVPKAPMPQAWTPYVQVENVDQTLERAKKLGATVHVAGEDIPGVGRIGILADPQGGWLGLLTPSA